MNILGIDIGTNLIKAVEAKKEKGLVEIINYAYAPAFKESLLSGSEEAIENYTRRLREFIANSSFTSTDVVSSLPESYVFTRVIEMTKLSSKELDKAILWEAEQYLPASIEDVDLNYQVLPPDSSLEKRKKMEVLLVAVPKKLIRNFIKVIEKSGLTPLGIEPESMAIARSIGYGELSSPNTLIMNIGSESTTISIQVDNHIRFTRNISTGGGSLARAISQDIGLEEKQAEEYLKSYGMDETKMDGKIRASIEPIYNVILNEVRKSIAYFETKKSPSRVKRIVLCGETSMIPGLLIYTVQYLSVEVVIADPWSKVTIDVTKKFNAKELDDIGPMFAASVGLVLKDI